jgi:hypothetical protein
MSQPASAAPTPDKAPKKQKKPVEQSPAKETEGPEAETSAAKHKRTKPTTSDATKKRKKKRSKSKAASKPPEPEDRPFHETPIGSLSHELLTRVFCALRTVDDCQSFAGVCHGFNAISKDSYSRATYFARNFDENFSLYHLVLHSKLCTPAVVDSLIPRAHFSRYFVSMLARAKMHTAPRWLANWGKKLSFAAYACFLKHAVEQFGEVELAKEMDDGTIVAEWVKSGGFRAGPLKQKVSWSDRHTLTAQGLNPNNRGFLIHKWPPSV